MYYVQAETGRQSKNMKQFELIIFSFFDSAMHGRPLSSALVGEKLDSHTMSQPARWLKAACPFPASGRGPGPSLLAALVYMSVAYP